MIREFPNLTDCKNYFGNPMTSELSPYRLRTESAPSIKSREARALFSTSWWIYIQPGHRSILSQRIVGNEHPQSECSETGLCLKAVSNYSFFILDAAGFPVAQFMTRLMKGEFGI
jgi:hypothetical protein